MATLQKHPMDLRPGEAIAVHPETGEPGQWTVVHPPVRFGEIAEIEYRDLAGHRDRFAIDQHTEVTVTTTPRQDAIASLRELADVLESPGGDDATPRGRQLIAALALAHLLGQDLPSVDWHVDEPLPGRLDGQITVHRGADRQLADMAAWAEFLRAEIVVTPRDGYADHRITADYRGAAVRVWMHIYGEPGGRS